MLQRTQRTRQGKNIKALYMGRPGKFGNPFRVVKYGDGKWGVKITPKYGQISQQTFILTTNSRPAYNYNKKADAVSDAIKCFREWLKANPHLIQAAKEAAKGHDCLSCWCKLNEPCHVDVWIEVLG